MDINWLRTVYTAITTFLGGIIHGVAGFGLSQVTMGIMPLFRDVASAAIITGIIAIVSNFRIWLSVKDAFEVKSLFQPIIGLLIGLPIGLFLFANSDEAQARQSIGIIILIAVATILVGKQTNILSRIFENITDRYNGIFAVIAGFIAGVLGGAVSIPGPPMIIYGVFMTSTGSWTGRKLKSVFTAFFGLLQLYRTGLVAFQGGLTLPILTDSLFVLPAMLFGVYIGIKIFNRFSNRIFNWVLIAALTINGLILLIQ
ncbi:MAG: sulfite exporter TauE/SafE family protein [Pisciglobus halotolerans]|nr:sulfite exporter TauE/SafE family protein [Pisciglobus halotolerans]